jgi:DNA invertase Pin-like site-specific DNA recombinase
VTEAPARCVIYLRVSDMDVDPNAKDPEADLKQKLAIQRELDESAVRALGWQVVKVYEERFTGTELHRPQLDAMRAELPTLGVSRIVVYSDDRLGRKDLVTRGIVDEFRKMGIEFHFVTFSMEGMSPINQELMFAIKTAISAWERNTIVDRMSRGAVHAKEEGTFFATLPRHFRQTPAGIIEPDDTALAIYNDRISGKTNKQVADNFSTHENDVRRTVRRVQAWRSRPAGVEWKRGKKVLRALRAT